jgi:WD40 repeat protein
MAQGTEHQYPVLANNQSSGRNAPPATERPQHTSHNYEYEAFVSYRRRDATRLAQWIRNKLQRFRLPPEILRELPREKQELHSRRPRIWLDTSYEKSSDDFLLKKVFPALDRSARLIVVSTPAALENITGRDGRPQDNWLVREVDHFLGEARADETDRPVDVVFGPGAVEGHYPGRLSEKPRWDWIDLRSFNTLRVRTFTETLDDGLAKLVAGLYDIPDRFLPVLRREERRRRHRAIFGFAVVAFSVAALTIALAIWGEINREEAEAQRVSAQLNQAQALVRLGDEDWAKRKVLDAELDYASALGVSDQIATRDKLLQVRGWGLRRLWDAPARVGGNVALLSAGGNELVVAQADLSVGVWDLDRSRQRLSLVGPAKPVKALALSPDGSGVASGDDGGTVLLWDLKTGAPVDRYAAGDAAITALAFDRNNSIWSLGADNVLTTRQLSTRQEPHKTHIGGALNTAAVFLPSARRLVIGDTDGNVRVIDADTGADLDSFRAEPFAIGAIALDERGEQLATWGTNLRAPKSSSTPAMLVHIWRLQDHAKLDELPESYGFPRTNALRFSPDGKFLAIGKIADGFAVWDLTNRRAQTAGRGATAAFAFSKESSTLLAVGQTLAKFQVTPLREVAWLDGHSAAIEGLAFSPDGQRLASTGLDGSVIIWDAATETQLQVLQGDAHGMMSIAFASNDELFGCTFGGNVKIWDLSKPTAAPGEIITSKFGNSHQCASSAAQGVELAAITADKVGLYNPDGTAIKTPPVTPSSPQAVAFSRDGRRIAIADGSGQIIIYPESSDLPSSPVHLIPALNNSVAIAIAWGPNGRIFSAASRGQVIIWNIDTPQKPLQQIVLQSDVHSLAFSPDGQRLMVATFGEVIILDPLHGNVLARFNPYQWFSSHIEAVAIDSQGFRLALGDDQARIWVFSVEQAPEANTLRPPDRMPGDNSFTPAIAFSSSDNNIAAITSYDEHIRLWDLGTARIIDTFEGHSRRDQGLSFSRDGRSLMIGSDDGFIRTVELSTHQEQRIAYQRDAPVHHLTPSRDFTKYAFATREGGTSDQELSTIVVWSPEQRKAGPILRGHRRNVEALAFHPSLPLLASGSYDQTARLWDLTNPLRFIELEGHGGTVTSVAFSPDGRWLATACRDGFVRIFDASDGAQVRTLHAASGYVEAVSFTPKSNLLIASGHGGTRTWKTGTWLLSLELIGQEDLWVQNAAVDPTGTWLVTSSQDFWLRVWDLRRVAAFAGESAAGILEDSQSRTGRMWRR